MTALLYRLRSVLALVVCTVLSLWLINRPMDSRFAIARGLQITVLSPVHTVISRITSLRNLMTEVEHLRERTGALMLENSSLQQSMRENMELRDMLDYQKTMPVALIPAEVIAMKRGGISSYVILKAGSSDGIQKNFPVTTVMGIAGKVIEVYPFHSIVRLIDDPAAKTGIRFKRLDLSSIMDCPDGITGRVSVQKHAEILPGDTVVTSGLGGLYPKGLFIGTVSSIDSTGELQKTARIKFHKGLHTMEHSLIMKVESMWKPFPEELDE
ncbi:MAG: rod shape-determining protein MreC [Fibrobacteres bacterium]|nr:rod shape-determining protein MreC [Fibrobacterota bacterium]